ncbi:antifreeze protein [Mycena galericulata]|nr:antifreeze protein [Mycena galericulata]
MISGVFNICFLTALASSVAALGPAAVNLRTAGNFAILSKAGVSTVPPSVITGNIGVSPISSTGLTGFSLTLASNGESATSGQVTGELFAASFTTPTPSTLTVAVGDMGTAFTDASGRTGANFTNLATGAIGGLVLTPGLYKWTSAVNIGSAVTISGAATDSENYPALVPDTTNSLTIFPAWIFQVTGALTLAAGAKVVLAGGAVSSNIVWVVTGTVNAAAGAHIEGVVLGKTSITLQTGATANSRLLAQTSVALQKATVTN